MVGTGSIICRRDNIPTVNLDGEVALMNPDKGKYYGFDLIASRVWELITKPISFEELVDQLLAEYNIDRQICENDIESLLSKLFEEDLIIAE